jgi:hypothetical protein
MLVIVQLRALILATWTRVWSAEDECLYACTRAYDGTGLLRVARAHPQEGLHPPRAFLAEPQPPQPTPQQLLLFLPLRPGEGPTEPGRIGKDSRAPAAAQAAAASPRGATLPPTKDKNACN